jgi:hypothetical protein
MATDFSKLTNIQLKVVKWCVSNGKPPIEAVKAGLCSQSSLYQKWKIDTVNEWIEDYIVENPPPMTEAEVQQALLALIPPSLATIQNAATTGRGDRVGVDTAKWILSEAFRAPMKAVTPQPDDVPGFSAQAELAKVLKLVVD